MTARRVLITGVGHDLGVALAQRLVAQPAIEQIIGIDTAPPRADLGRLQFVRADIRHPLIAKVVASAAVDTVVHLGVLSTPLGAGGRTAMKETNVIGTMQLLAACQKAPSVRTLVVRSTTAVYGASSFDPALFAEDTAARIQPTSGYAKDAVEVEGYVRGFQRRRADVAVTVLRLAHLLGPDVDSSLTRYLTLPIAPTVLGFDPRMQLLHAEDALAVLQRAMTGAAPGVFNVAGDGVLLLSQALRRLGRPTIAMAAPVLRIAGQLARRLRLADYSPEQLRDFEQGRAVDTAALKADFGYAPAFTTAETFEDFAARHPGPLRRVQLAEQAEQAALGLLERRRLVRA
jgi:UDP-glucose 4-epimerase